MKPPVKLVKRGLARMKRVGVVGRAVSSSSETGCRGSAADSSQRDLPPIEAQKCARAVIVRNPIVPPPCCWRDPNDFGYRGRSCEDLKPLWDKSPELLDGIGGEQLAESGFACEQPEGEFAMQESNEEGEE